MVSVMKQSANHPRTDVAPVSRRCVPRVSGWALSLSGLMLVNVFLSVAAHTAHGEEKLLGYINQVPPETAEQRAARHKKVAERRAGVPIMVHRGVKELAPEMTFESYSAISDVGADGADLDIRRTRDGVLYIFHDDTMERLTHGEGKVKERTYYEILKVSPKRISGRATKDSRIPTLASILYLFRERGLLIHLDLKEKDIQDEIIRLMDELDMWDHIVEVNGGNADKIRPDKWNEGKPGPHNKVRLIPYKGWAPEQKPYDLEAIRKWFPSPGQMAFTENPIPVCEAVGRPMRKKPEPLPKGLRAWWSPSGILSSQPAG